MNKVIYRKNYWALFVAALSILGIGAFAQSRLSALVPRQANQEAVASVLRDALSEAEAGDLNGFASRLSSGFYMYDHGKRYDANALIEQMRALHGSGSHLHWSVTQEDVHVHGDSAWIAYVNQGSMVTKDGVIPRQWLESAFLTKQTGAWKIEFWHSSPVAQEDDHAKRAATAADFE